MLYHVLVSAVQFSSVALACPTLCDPMNCSTPGLPVHHQLPELTQTHVHRVSDAIQPLHPLSSPSPAPNPQVVKITRGSEKRKAELKLDCWAKNVKVKRLREDSL